MKSIADLLAEHPTFAPLTAELRALVGGCGRNVSFDAGEFLLREGAPADRFFAVRRGQVAIGVHVPHGGDLVLETVGPGEIVGWSWLFPPYTTQFDARATVSTQAVSFDGACLRGKCDANPALGYALMKAFAAVMTSRLQAARMRLLDMYGTPR